jgi:CBS domain-containing protein
MTLADVCKREVVFVNREVTVHAACKLMRHYRVGSLVVVDEAADEIAKVGGDDRQRVPVGIVTDRDIVVEVYALELDPKVMTAGDIMSPDLVTVPESLAVADTIEVMRAGGVRRLPVVNEENRLVGIVTIDDLLAVLAAQLSGIAHVVSRDPGYDENDGRVRLARK